MANDTVKATVLGAKDPRAAISVLCDYIDQLLDRIETLERRTQHTDGGWASWDADALPRTVPFRRESLVGESRVGRVEPYEPELPQLPEPTGRIKHIQQGEQTIVDIAEPTPDQAKLRRLMTKQRMNLLERAKEIGWALKPEQDPDVMFERFGPYWLYTVDRDYVMMLPIDTRKIFVTDIELDDPQIAKEVARDILKADAQDSNTSGL